MTLLEIGRIGKPHGLRGDVLVSITSDRPERTASGAVWVLDDGPVTVASSRPQKGRWVVHLVGIDSIEAVEALNGQIVRAEPIEDPDALWVHELIGAEVRTPDGTAWGRVVTVIDNPADDLLELEDGTLIPAGFVTDSTGLPDHLVVEVPEGLLGADD